jgi:hypothetical protein
MITHNGIKFDVLSKVSLPKFKGPDRLLAEEQFDKCQMIIIDSKGGLMKNKKDLNEVYKYIDTLYNELKVL